MKDLDFELVRGSGNVYRDFGDPNADVNWRVPELPRKLFQFSIREKFRRATLKN